MRKPGQPDTLIKIASLGGGGVAVGANLQSTANRHKKIKEELEKAKLDEAAYQNKIKALKAKQAAKRLEKAKEKK